MEKRVNNHWLENSIYPSDFFEALGNALTSLGNIFMFKSDNQVKSKISAETKDMEAYFENIDRILRSPL
jgi:hypothetical protein